MSRITNWICDSCGDLVTSEATPEDWRRAFFQHDDSEKVDTGKDLCGVCAIWLQDPSQPSPHAIQRERARNAVWRWRRVLVH